MRLSRTANIVLRVLAALLFVPFFVLEGEWRWFGALGLIPLFAATIAGCPWERDGACPLGDGSEPPRAPSPGP
ncbi:MAG: hypothetical protein HY057_02675 [Rhodospirillales bacterium]|nr:hypothetical protein [Rhodospirillales bacterium]